MGIEDPRVTFLATMDKYIHLTKKAGHFNWKGANLKHGASLVYMGNDRLEVLARFRLDDSTLASIVNVDWELDAPTPLG
jgi:hypothetical protein